MRAIDADALVEKLNLAISMMSGMMKMLNAEDDEVFQMELKAYRDIRDGIKEEPTIEPEPKRGKWIEDRGQKILMQNFIAKGEVWRVCSVCGAGHMIGHKYACDKAYHDTHHSFCPNCGARMEVTE